MGVSRDADRSAGTAEPIAVVDAAVESKAVPAGDEDAVTMAVAAARDALDRSDRSRAELDALGFASTTPPVDEGEISATVAGILGLDSAVDATAFTGSTRAGTRAVRAAADAGGPALVVAADAPRAAPGDAVEHAAGAGAAALLVEPAGERGAAPGHARVVDAATHTAEFPGVRFRRRGSDAVEAYGATTYERDAYRTVVGGAADGLDVEPLSAAAAAGSIALAPTAPDGKLPGRAARAVGFDATAYEAATELGDAGAASPLLGLLSAWADGREAVAVVGYGAGAAADALAVVGRPPDPPAPDGSRETTDIDYAAYARKRGHLGGEAE